MAFVFVPNTVADVWFNVDVVPWLSGDPPDAADLPCQQARPYFDIGGNAQSGTEAGHPYTERLFFDGTVFFPVTATYLVAEQPSFIRLAGNEELWFAIVGVQAHMDGVDLAYQQVWCKRIADPVIES